MAKGRNSYIKKRWYAHAMSLPDCFYCGATEGSFQCDHIVPPQKGGLPELGNFIKACISCNASKGDRLLSDWLQHCIRKREEIFIKTKKYIRRCALIKKTDDLDLRLWLNIKIKDGRKQHSIWSFRIWRIKPLIELYG